ncbi:MAG: MotA/TolQ/ExbB proton channel family protein, partial [Akkermansiaceae bacterium]|nr:MotA/TolQ/ExbB proton channel family protein [Akkermansiaceae bacterium]
QHQVGNLAPAGALKTSTLAIPGSPHLEIEPEILATSPADPSLALSTRLSILDASLDRLELLLGGSSSPGTAADPDGNILPGTFAALGPASYFLTEDKSTGGDVTLSKTGGTPHFTSSDTNGIATLLSGKQATLPLDITGGNARAMDELSGSPLDLIRKGGLWIWPIIFLALLSLTFGIIKLSQFAKFREPTEMWVNAILAAIRTGDREKATQLAKGPAHPAAPVMAKLVAVSENSADLIEETLYEQLMSVQAKAGTLLPVIAITAATAPLLGLLGTVSGMISTFNLITLFGSGDPKPLAGGISEALITTLFGLVVAIPALVLHAFLSRRAQGITQTTERLGLSFVNGLRTKH